MTARLSRLSHLARERTVLPGVFTRERSELVDASRIRAMCSSDQNAFEQCEPSSEARATHLARAGG
jgi:hypothetical protein